MLNAQFRPLDQWPGERTKSRKESTFRATWLQTLDLLEFELGKLRARGIVIQVEDPEAIARIRNDGSITVAPKYWPTIGKGGDRVFNVDPVGMGMLALGIGLFVRPMFAKKTTEMAKVSAAVQKLTDNTRYRFRQLSRPEQVALKIVFQNPGMPLNQLQRMLRGYPFPDPEGATRGISDAGFVDVNNLGLVTPKGPAEVIEGLEELVNELQA